MLLLENFKFYVGLVFFCSQYISIETAVSLEAHTYWGVLSTGHIFQIEVNNPEHMIHPIHSPTVPTAALSFLHSHPGPMCQSRLRTLLLLRPLHCLLLLFQSHASSAPPLLCFILKPDTQVVHRNVGTSQMQQP